MSGSGSRGGGRRGSRAGAAGYLPLCMAIAGAVVAAGCTSEHRGGNDEAAAPEEVPGEGVGVPGAQEVDPAAPVLEVIRTFREATAIGDLSLALALMDREALVADDLAGPADEEATRGELLLQLRSRHSGGAVLTEKSAEVWFPGEVAVVFSTLDLEEDAVAGAGVGGGAGAVRVHETAILLRRPEGWRIRHLHRSIPSLD